MRSLVPRFKAAAVACGRVHPKGGGPLSTFLPKEEQLSHGQNSL